MSSQKKQRSRYLRRVRALLPCGRKQKARLIAKLQPELDRFLDENPGAGAAELEARFGEPKDYAAMQVENTGTAEILRGLLIRRRILRAVAAALAAIVLVWAIGVTISVIELRKSYKNSTIEVITSVGEEMPDPGGLEPIAFYP